MERRVKKAVSDKCKGCKALNCFGCSIEAEIKEMLTSPKVLRSLLLTLVVGLVIACQGCSTVAGLGEDLAWSARATQHAIKNVD